MQVTPQLQPPTQEQLSEIRYDPISGKLHWKVYRRGRKDPAGTSDGKYRKITFDGQMYQEHQVIWYIVTGNWVEVDHEDRNGENNKWENLRDCSRTENNFNTSIRSDNTSGHKGVVWHKKNKKWQAQITINGRCVFLGTSEDYNVAVGLRLAAEAKLTNGFGNSPTPSLGVL